MGDLACSKKIAVKMEHVPGVLLSLRALRALVEGIGREVTLASFLSEKWRREKMALEQLPHLIAEKWTKGFSLDDWQPKTIHLVYKWNRGRWEFPFLR